MRLSARPARAAHLLVAAFLLAGCSGRSASVPAEPTEPQVHSQPATAPATAPATRPAALLSTAARERNLESFDVVWRTIRDRHYDATLGGVDWQAARDKYLPLVGQATSTDEARAHMQSMIDLLGQSHMALIPGTAMDVLSGDDAGEDSVGKPSPTTRQDAGAAASDEPIEPATETRAQAATGPGVDDATAPDGEAGMSLRLVDVQQKLVLVTNVRPGGGAEAAGVKPGWQLLRLDGRDVDEVVQMLADVLAQRGRGKPEMYVSAALEHRLHGKVGQNVGATFLDGEGNQQALEIPFKAGTGEVTILGALPPIRVNFESRRIEKDGRTLGYIAFNAFLDPPRLTPLLETAMRDFCAEENRVDGIVLDVRGNMGGIVMMVPGIAGYFIDEKGVHMGTLHTRDTDLKLVVFPRLVQFPGPLAVLTDACSVSAAELLSGGLQAVGRARIFGAPTAGEALPAQFMRLPNGDTFLFVFADYATTSGRRLEGDGVLPDEPVAYDRAALLAGEDPMINAAAKWIAQQAEAPATSQPQP